VGLALTSWAEVRWVTKMAKKKKCLTNTRAAEEIMEAHSSWNQKVLKQM